MLQLYVVDVRCVSCAFVMDKRVAATYVTEVYSQ